MAERRTLTDGLKVQPGPLPAAPLPPAVVNGKEQRFVFGDKEPTAGHPASVLRRLPITTRVRADFALALKRASLERQLKAIEPHTLQDILEEAIEPWLRTHGYIA